MNFLNSLVVRLGIAALLLLKVIDDIFATVGVIAFRLGEMGFVEAWGRQTPGDDYARLLPLIEAVPAWLHGLWLLAALVLIAAIAMTVVGRWPAYLLVLMGMGVEVMAQVLGRPIIEATGVVATTNPSLVRTFVIPFAVPIFLALVLWLAHGRRAGGSPTPAAST